MVRSEKEILASLKAALVDLDIEGIKKISEEAVAAGIPAYKAVIEGMSRGMEIVGQKYEDGEYFLSELIMAGRTMKEGMAVLEPHLKAGEIQVAGKIVVGTVRGDLHDIGKNVIVTLWKASNFEVFDLGVDVPVQEFVKTIRERNPDIVGMSALLTTTMIEMESVIKELETADLRKKVKIIIGGAPTTPEYAKKIGADAYAKDAVDGLRICREWMDADLRRTENKDR